MGFQLLVNTLILIFQQSQVSVIVRSHLGSQGHPQRGRLPNLCQVEIVVGDEDLYRRIDLPRALESRLWFHLSGGLEMWRLMVFEGIRDFQKGAHFGPRLWRLSKGADMCLCAYGLRVAFLVVFACDCGC